jgi:signal transduction histidine kinase
MMVLLGGSLVIPVLLISIIGIGSVSRQKQIRSIQLREQWQRRLELTASDLEKEMDRSSQDVFTSLSREALDPGRPLQIQQRLKNLLAAHPIVTYPFLITAGREYLFPFTRPMIAAPARVDFSSFSSSALQRRFQAGEALELDRRDWLGAIKEFLAGAGLAATRREKAVLALAIGRCYFKWGKYPQAMPYLGEAMAEQGLQADSDRFLSLEARQLLALAQDRMGENAAAAESYLRLYERVLELQAASQSVQLDFFKNEALEYLNRQALETAPIRQRLTRALKREHWPETAPGEMSLRWQYFRFQELEPEGAIGGRQWIESRRLQQVQEFYLLNDEKKSFYARLQKILSLNAFESASAREARSGPGYSRQADLRVAFAPLPAATGQEAAVYFGFQVSIAHVRRVLLPALRQRYWPGTGPEIVLVPRGEAVRLAANDMPQLGLEKFLSGYALAVKASLGFLEGLIRKELLINYTLIVSLLLTLLAAVALFFRSLRRDMEVLEMKSSFLDSAAHTLKTPLARIRLLSEQLQLDWLKNEEQRAAQPGKIIAETDRMNDLVANLLDFSRIEAGQKTYNFQKTSLAKVARQTWNEFLPLLEDNGFVCRAEIEAGLPELDLDARAMRMVIGNLVQNAIGYSPGSKDVELRVHRSGSEALLEVADHGQGIAPEFHRDIFSKFFRIEQAGAGSPGSGLGLFLVKHAIDAHGGRIEVHSVAGQGTRFIIRLPIAPGMDGVGK